MEQIVVRLIGKSLSAYLQKRRTGETTVNCSGMEDGREEDKEGICDGI